MKKYNEKMIVRNGKMVYAISLSDKSNNRNSERTHILIENGEIHFSNNWYSDTIDFNFNDEAHKIAKDIFISQLQVDIKRRILELKQLEEITNQFKGVDKSFAIQAGREVRVMVVPDQVDDAAMVLLARDISKQIEANLEYPGQIKVNVIRESRVTDYAK